MKKNSYMALLLALLMVATLVGCSSGVQNGTSDKPSDTTSNQTILQEATEWFRSRPLTTKLSVAKFVVSRSFF